jgi:hypothetical protein
MRNLISRYRTYMLPVILFQTRLDVCGHRQYARRTNDSIIGYSMSYQRTWGTCSTVLPKGNACIK